MFYFRLITTAMRSLDAHFLRSLLATLGVLIGVASVVSCMSILEGFSTEIAKSFRSMGSNVLFITPVQARVGGRPIGAATQTLTVEDVRLIERELADHVEAVAPQATGPGGLAKRFQKSQTCTVIATNEAYFRINAVKLASGRAFNSTESADESATVACLGKKVADELFGGADAVGQPVKIGPSTYRVVGVLEKRGSIGFINADESVVIPITAGLKRYFNRRWFDMLVVGVKDSTTQDKVKASVKRMLRESHRIRLGQQEDFNIYNQEEAMQGVNQTLGIFKIVFYSIAGISLVVGGIGIMNIMLVSVTERTREIGVRMAVGARRLDILLQFLVEALIISLVGGGCGLLLGAMFADILEKVVVDFFKTVVSPLVIMTAVLTAVSVGVASGLYPAYKASRLDPVDALRYE
ncbi:Macrolide export ATP-binding/permease protein MacB [Phycisphaerae bacterium RAS1]|nr:Macrolide export ATP-binding/permease protein MacB [Phycisphaerae bacterium RAS1]